MGPCCPALLESYSRKCAYCCIIGQIKWWWWWWFTWLWRYVFCIGNSNRYLTAVQLSTASERWQWHELVRPATQIYSVSRRKIQRWILEARSWWHCQWEWVELHSCSHKTLARRSKWAPNRSCRNSSYSHCLPGNILRTPTRRRIRRICILQYHTTIALVGLRGAILLGIEPAPLSEDEKKMKHITSRLRSSQILPRVHTRTKRYCSFIQYGLNHYQ